MDLLVKEIPAPQGDIDGPLQLMVTTLDSDEYVGRVAIGRVMRGKIREGQNVVVISAMVNRKNVLVKYMFIKV